MKFIDLFAGLGGFHLALRELGHECVFACEIDDHLSELYEKNLGIRPAKDIREVNIDGIPAHDILCAGFPCQPFSKAGSQLGFDCPKWGDLFGYICEILSLHRPQYFILENVPNLQRHNEGQTWLKIESDLRSAGYSVKAKCLSPHQFGIPQIRERVFIVGSLSELSENCLPEPIKETESSIYSVLENNSSEARPLSDQVIRCLEVWQEFLDRFPKEQQLPSFPIWSAEFGATYHYQRTTPYKMKPHNLRGCRSSHGASFRGLSDEEMMRSLPSYARVKQNRFPGWKVRFIQQNRDLYDANKSWIDEWMPRILEFPPSLQKFEWNCKGDKRDIWEHVIQFRASGVRVKRPTTAPSLVAMTTTQVPIIGWERRYMTPTECARLQGMHGLQHLPNADTRAFKALGNGVNVDLVKTITEALISDSKPISAKVRTHSISIQEIAALTGIVIRQKTGQFAKSD